MIQGFKLEILIFKNSPIIKHGTSIFVALETLGEGLQMFFELQTQRNNVRVFDLKRVFKCSLIALSTLVNFKLLCIININNLHFGLCGLIEQTKAHFSPRFKFLITNLNFYEAN